MAQEPIYITTWDSIAENPDGVDVTVIVKGILDTDEEISAKACRALGRRTNVEDVRPFTKRLLRHSRSFVRMTAIGILPEVSRTLALKYCPKMALSDKDISVCEVAFEKTLTLLVEEKDQGLPKPQEIRASPFTKRSTNKASTDSLSQFLLDAVENERKDIRLIAAKNLSFFRYREDFPRFLLAATRLAKDKADEVRQKAVYEIGDYVHKETLSLLREALRDPSETVREWALIVLSQERWKGYPDALSTLAFALEDPNIQIRLRAAETLVQEGWKPENEEQNIMFRIVKNEYDDLERFGPAAARFICAHRRFTQQMEAVLVKLGQASTEFLYELLDDYDWAVRRDAARILSKIANINDVKRLQKMVAKETNGEVQFWLRKAIENCETQDQ